MSGDGIDLPGIPNCKNHGDVDAVDECDACGLPICSDCVVIFEGMDLCPECRGEKIVGIEGDLALAEREIAEVVEAMDAHLSGGGVATDEEYRSLDTRKEMAERRARRLKGILDKA